MITKNSALSACIEILGSIGVGMIPDLPAIAKVWSDAKEALAIPDTPDTPDTPDLHSPENEPLILAAVTAYEAMRNRASIEARMSMQSIAVFYDRISNAEEESPFGYGPPSGLPYLCKWGKPITTIVP